MLSAAKSKRLGREIAEELWHAFVEASEVAPLRSKWDDVYGVTMAVQMEADPVAFNEGAAKVWAKFKRARVRDGDDE